ncbi:RyR domain-containing protein [Hirschia litorea]|uniref:RyR domain-containing protein n=1 Tax=Hirschia litorea TaxID=1199156 RepID=A0ABW2IH01_9PROT
MANPISEDQIQIIARVMHEAIRAFQAAHGELPAPHWNQAPKWMKKASVEGVLFKINNPNASVSAQHDQWMETKLKDGWVFGHEKDGKKKTHPLLVPYEKLPFPERQKDALVAAIITSLTQEL